MAKIVLADFEFDTSAIERATEENIKLKKSILETRDAQKIVNKDLKDGKIGYEEAAASITKNENELKKLNKSYSDNSKVIQANSQANKDLSSAINGTIKSEAQATANISKLTQARKGLDVTTKSGQERLVQLNAAIDKNNAFLTKNSDQFTKQKRNVGNYTDSMKQALNSTNLFGGSLSGVSGVARAASPIFTKLSTDVKATVTQYKTATAATQGMTTAQTASATATAVTTAGLKLFRIALISTGIGALVVALGSLVAFLGTTQKGMDAVTKVTRPLQAILQSTVGVIQDFGEKIFEAFSNPKQLMTDLVDFLKDQLINRVKAFGVILDGIINLDFKKVADGVLQAQTGLTNMTDRIASAAESTRNFLTEAAEKGTEIDKLTKSIEASESTLVKTRSELNLKTRQLKKDAEDITKSEQERIAAAEAASEIQNELVKLEQEIIDKKITRLKIEQSLNDTSREDIKELSALEAERSDAEARATKLQTTLTNQKNTIGKSVHQEALKRENERVAKLISGLNEELEYFKQVNKEKAETLDESLEFERDISRQKLDILTAEFEAGKISETKYRTEQSKITESFLSAQSALVVEFAQKEVDSFLSSNQSKIEAGQLLTVAIVNEERERLNAQFELQKEFEAKKLEQGVISQEQYNSAINTINEENASKVKENQENFIIQEQERVALEIENQRLLDEENYNLQTQIKLERLEEQRLIDVEAAEALGASTTAINERYEKKATELKQKEAASQINTQQKYLAKTGELLNAAFGDQKEVSLALAVADAALGVQKAYVSQLIPADPTSLPRAILAGAQAGVFGAANVAKIAQASFDQGGVVSLDNGRINQKSNIPVQKGGDNILATVKTGEVILNESQQAALGGAMTFKNIGVPGFANGGIVAPTSLTKTAIGLSAQDVANIAAEVSSQTKVINVARDTVDISSEEIRVENEAIV